MDGWWEGQGSSNVAGSWRLDWYVRLTGCGFWLLLWVAAFILWFLLVPLIVALSFSRSNTTGNNRNFGLANHLLMIMIRFSVPLIFLFLLLLLFYENPMRIRSKMGPQMHEGSGRLAWFILSLLFQSGFAASRDTPVKSHIQGWGTRTMRELPRGKLGEFVGFTGIVAREFPRKRPQCIPQVNWIDRSQSAVNFYVSSLLHLVSSFSSRGQK